jgi:hypothetical protein
MERLEEVGHGFETQINESFNNTFSWFAPKNKVYCGSQSLKNRLSMAIRINSLGLHQYFVTRLFKILGLNMPPPVAHFLHIKQVNREKRQNKRQLRKSKQQRKDKYYESLRKNEQLARKEAFKQDGTFKKGQNMDEGGANGYTSEELLQEAARKPKNKKSRKDLVCPHCKKTGHMTTRSKDCMFHKTGPPRKEAPAASLVEPPKDLDDAEAQITRFDCLPLTDDVPPTEDSDVFEDCVDTASYCNWSSDEEEQEEDAGVSGAV